MEPVAVLDVAHAIRGALGSRTATGIYDIGAGEGIRYPDLVQKLLEHLGEQRPSLSVPILPQALVTTIATWISDIPPATVTALMESLREDMVARDRRWVAELLPADHREVITVDDALQLCVIVPDPARPPGDRDLMGALPGDPAWATSHS